MKSIKFVSTLAKKDIVNLEYTVHNSLSHRIRSRAHSILLSAKGFIIKEIVDIIQVDRKTVSSWIDRWEQFGHDGLLDLQRPGRPPKLTKQEKKLLKN